MERKPHYQVVADVIGSDCHNGTDTKPEILGTFYTYEEAEEYSRTAFPHYLEVYIRKVWSK